LFNLSQNLASLFTELRREFFSVYFPIFYFVFMSKMYRQAGQNIRELAFKRRKKAIAYFMSAGFVILSPLFGVKFVENFSKTGYQLKAGHLMG
jgi:hypothetical protein